MLQGTMALPYADVPHYAFEKVFGMHLLLGVTHLAAFCHAAAKLDATLACSAHTSRV